MSHPADPAAVAAAQAAVARWQGTPQPAVATPPPTPPAGAAWWEPRTFKVHLPAGWLRGPMFVLWLFGGPGLLGSPRDPEGNELAFQLWLGGFVVLAAADAVLRLRLGGHLTIDPGARQLHWRRPRDFAPTRSWSFDAVTRAQISGIHDRIRLVVGGRNFQLDADPAAAAAVAALEADVRRRAGLVPA